MLFVFDDIRDRLTNRHLLFLNRSLAHSRQKVTELLNTNILFHSQLEIEVLFYLLELLPFNLRTL